jgi:UDP-3-O-[3-hydroxymyristoyl] glucosamine N-acyltransferase
MRFTIAEIALKVEGRVIGDSSVVLDGFAPADYARAGQLTFAESPDYFSRAEKSGASAIIVDGSISTSSKVLICVPNPRVAFARILSLFFPEPGFAPGIHPTAVIADSAIVDSTAHIGPHCAVGENVRIGKRSALQGGNHIGANSRIGEDANFFPNVTVYPGAEIGNRVRIHAGTVVGSDGFGYVLDKGVQRKVQQAGNVILGDDVEIGANVTIDRGALGPTIIGKGTKIDNLVQIAHNVVIGEHCIVVAQTAFAGSTRVGDYVVIGGQVGIAGHLNIGNHVTLAAKSGVMHDIPDGEKWWGTPAQPDRQTKRELLALRQLPELIRRVRDLEKRLGDQ